MAYSYPLEDILKVELSILERSESIKYLEKIFFSLSKLQNIPKNSSLHSDDILPILQTIVINYHQLVFYFNHTITIEFENSTSHYRVRYLGLVLSGFYLPQLLDWITSDIIRFTTSRLLIVQSEYMFQHRLQFFKDNLCHFLHPNRLTNIPIQWSGNNYPHDSRNRNIETTTPTSFDTKSFILLNQTSSTSSSIRPISNQKLQKSLESLISVELRTRLSEFYSGKYFGKEITFHSILLLLHQLDSTKYVIKPSIDLWTSWINSSS